MTRRLLATLTILFAVFLFGCAATMPIRLHWTRVYGVPVTATATMVKVTQQTTPYIHHTPRPYATRQR